MFPDFLCIGAQKAGTTWLHRNLAQQPEVWLPPVKEIHFLDHPQPTVFQRLFSRRSHHRLPRVHAFTTALDCLRGSASPSQFRKSLTLAYGRRDWDWYDGIFPDDPSFACGEICPGYARLSNDVIKTIVARNPRIKVIYLLRDPIDRAWSALAMHFRKRPGTTVQDRRPEEILGRLMLEKNFAHCRYEDNISRWLKHVPGDQMYFGFFERIEEHPEGFLAEILSFLNVSSSVVSVTARERVNSSMGETMEPAIERAIARVLKREAASLHRRFANRYTEHWLAHAESEQPPHKFRS